MSSESFDDKKDPRFRADFDATCWPLCNGLPAPAADTGDPHERRCLEFLAFFYQLNVLNSRLLDTRRHGQAGFLIDPILEEIGAVTAALENLEDRYASIGFYGEPVMNGIYYENVVFVRPGLFTAQTEPVWIEIPIPGLDEIPKSELTGPNREWKWSNGKMDF